MKRLLISMLLAGAFLGGYYLGHEPDSPDIFGWAKKTYARLSDRQDETTGRAQAPAALAWQDKTPDQIVVEVGGELYRIGSKTLAGAWGK